MLDIHSLWSGIKSDMSPYSDVLPGNVRKARLLGLQHLTITAGSAACRQNPPDRGDFSDLQDNAGQSSGEQTKRQM